MRKIFTLFVLCLALAGWAQGTDYSGIQISFNKSTATVNAFTDVAVVVKDLDGNVIPGVTAEAISSEGGEIVSSAMGSGSAAALTWTTGAIIGARFNNNNYPSGSSSNYVIKISGLRSGFTYNMADVDLYGCNRLGAACSSSSIAIAVDVQTGSTSSGLSSFVSSTGNNINGSQEGGLWHKVSSMISNTTRAVGAEEDLYVKVVIQKTNDNGTQCRPCFRTLTLSQLPTFNVTYRIKDVDDNTIFTYDPIVVESGTTITTLPSNYQRPLFYDYNTVNVTVTEDQTIDFTATLKSSAPFKFTANTTNPIWYSLTMSAAPNYVTYSSGGTQNVTLPTADANNATTHWAFIGNPYDGFTIVNKSAGTSLVLGSAATTGSANNGGAIYATLQAANSQANELWFPADATLRNNGVANAVVSSGKNGFYLFNAEGHALNKRNGTANISYWTGGYDEGSTFVATPVLLKAIAEANALKDIYDQYAGNPMFPTTAAASTFAPAITTAQNVYDNGGDQNAAYDALLAAMSTVQANESLVTTPRTDVVYTITSPRGSWAVGSEATEINSTHANGLNLAFSADDVKQQFAFIPHGGNYYLYSVSEKKFAYIDGTKLSLSALFTAEVENCPVTFTRSTYTDAKNYPAIVTINGRHFGVHQSKNPTVFQYEDLTDQGNAARLIAGVAFDNTAALDVMQNYYDNDVTYVVEDEVGNTLFTSPAHNANIGTNITVLPEEYKLNAFYTYNTIDLTTTQQHTTATFTATLKDQSEWPVIYTEEGQNPVYNNLNIRSKYLVYDSEATGEIALQQNSEPFNDNAAWAFIGTPYSGFKMINKAKGTDSYLIYTSVVTGGNHGNNNIQFQSAQDLGAKRWLIENNTNGFVLRMMENTAIYFHHDDGSNFLRTCSVSEWSSVHNDPGSTIIASDDFAEVEALYDALKDIPFGTALGQYSTGAITLQDASATIINAATPIQNKQYNAYPDLYAGLKQISDARSLNMPQAGSFLRIKTAPAHAATNATVFGNTQPYLIGTNHTTQTTRAAFSTDASASSAANSIWYLAEISGTKYLVAYSNGYPAVKDEDQRFGVGTGTQYLASNGTSIVFEEAANKEVGTYNVKFGTNRYLFTTTGLYTDAGDAANGSNANGYNFELEAVTSLPVTVTAAGYSSLYLPVSVEIPEGVIAYIATVDQDVLRFTKVEGIIPAETPVVLEAEAGTYNFVVSAEDGSISGTNALQGSVANEACDDGVHYTLQKPANMGIGFYRYSGTKLTGFKAYLPGSAVSGSGIRGFAFEDAFIDITTGIERFDNIQSDEIYDLQGRRVTTPAKGLYIIGGKKVYIK